MAFGVVGTMAAIGFLGGILLGGVCAQWLTWRWIFYITAIINGLMIVSALLIIPKTAGEEEHQPANKVQQRLKEIDWWGQILSVSGFIMLAFSLTFILK